MSNRTVFYLTIIALIAIALLFLIDIRNITLYTSAIPEVYLKHNEVSGIAVQFQDKVYTLNFDQQNRVIDIVNRSLPVVKHEKIIEKPNFQKITVYTFGKTPDIEITPIGYGRNDDLIYTAPLLEPTGYLMEVSEGDLKKIIDAVHPQQSP